MLKRLIYWVLLLLLLADISYSFRQHYSTALDGDMAGGIVPAENVKPILKNPLGIGVITRKERYPNPNRFFCHWTFKEYFSTVPLLLQRFVAPIESVYLSCAIFKTAIQVALIFLLAVAILGSANVLRLEFIVAALLLSPLFQTNGYRTYMGIIDPSMTYTFFYAFPCALLLLYFLPFVREQFHQKPPISHYLILCFWIPLSLIVALSGVLNAGVVLIVSMLMLIVSLKNNYTQSAQNQVFRRFIEAIISLPKNVWLYWFPISLICLYSLYIGHYNSLTLNRPIPLFQLYLRLPLGLYYQMTQKLGFPILFLVLTTNVILIKRNYFTNEGKKILTAFRWIACFAFLYIVLLPLGGYKEYRPNVLRYDTIMPITLSLMFLFGSSTLFLLKKTSTKQKKWYIPFIVVVLLIFTSADEAIFDGNTCERLALKEIAEAKDSVVQLQNDCKVLAWGKLLRPEESDLNARLLQLWRITKTKKRYYNK